MRCIPHICRVIVLSFLLAVTILVCKIPSLGQCQPPGPTSPPSAPSISASPGPDYNEIQYTVGGFDPTATTEVWMSTDLGVNYIHWANASPSDPSGGRQNIGGHWTVYLMARNVNSCGHTDTITQVTTFDYPIPVIQAWAGPTPNTISYWSHYIGPSNHAIYSQVQGVFPSGLELTLYSFNEQPPQSLNVAPGVYRFYATTLINPWEWRTSDSVYVAIAADQNLGSPSCNSRVGDPVNVTNGNMYLAHTDYVLPGVGEMIDLTRSYNSLSTSSGLFGAGWTTKYDENIVALSNLAIRLEMADGRGAYFGRPDINSVFKSATPDLQGQVVKNSDGSFDLTFKDGRVHKFDLNGRLLWQKDRNGNQTTLAYDSNGILTNITDATGRVLNVSVNGYGNVSSISDSVGSVATYDYYPNSNQLKSATYPDGSKIQYEYATINGKQYLTSAKDALNNVLEAHAYDQNGKATTSERDGGVLKFTFDYSVTGMTTVTDALSNVTKFYFSPGSGRNVVSKIEGVCGCSGGTESTQFYYDDRLNLVKKTDALNRDTVYTYDSDRNVTAVTDVLGTQTFTYNSFGEVLTATDRMGGVTTNTYDAAGNLLTTKDALNNTTTLTYTSLGQPSTVKDALNHTTTLTWDAQGRMTKITDANGKETNLSYNGRALVTGVTNAKSETTSFTYDLNNRLKKVIYPDTNFVEFAYDLAGRRTAVTDPLSHTTNYSYDGAYRLTGVTDALNHTTSYVYDLMSNVISKTDALGNVNDLEYDDFNRLKKIKYPLPTAGATRLEESYTYDLVGNVKTRVDTAGRTTTYDYDSANRLIKITDPMAQATQFEYNARSQMTKVTDALNQQYVFTYDPLGRQLSETRAGTSMSYEYDAVGNRTKRTDYIGRETTYEYDVLNRLKKINYLQSLNGIPPQTPIGTATYSYDDLSRVVSAVNESGTVAFTYDNRNRLKTETDVFGHVIEYGYNAASLRTQLKLDGSVQASYVYDNADRLTTLSDEAGQNFTFGYDNANRLTSKAMPNGITSTFGYDGMSRLSRLMHQSATATLIDNQYSYNAADQISQITELGQTKTFGYDNVDRLTLMTNGTSNESYTFDAVGNRTASHLSASYGYQPFNRLTSTATATQSIDANGNTVSRSEGSNFWRYVWDQEGRLAAVSTRKQTVRYAYDALGRRVRRHFAGSKENTKYTYDGLDVVLDDDLGVLTKYQNGLGIDSKLEIATGGTSKYFLQDHLGSTVVLTNSAGSVTEANSFDSFGNPTNAGSSSRYQFTGREFDSFSGLQYSRARWYDPKIGRFISEDPIGFRGGDVNLYGYVWNNPQNYTDPFGLDAEWDEQVWRAQQDLLEAFAPAIRFGIGFGDEATLGISSGIRNLQRIEDPNVKCSWEYQAGGWTAFAIEVVAGGVGGLRAAGAKGAGMEFSHWIPKRLGGPRSMLNGNYVTIAEHALSDPYRYRFMPRFWKSLNPMPNAAIQQWARIPTVYKGVAVGAGIGSFSMMNSSCECK